MTKPKTVQEAGRKGGMNSWLKRKEKYGKEINNIMLTLANKGGRPKKIK